MKLKARSSEREGSEVGEEKVKRKFEFLWK
jgi:hypothetical protein